MRKLLIEATPLNTEDLLSYVDSLEADDDTPEVTDPRGCAGTDHPWYEDGKGFEISGSYDDEDAVPFGYWPISPKTRELRFFIYVNEYSDDYGAVHNDIFGDALYDYLYNFIFETFEPVEDELCEEMKAFYDFTQANGLEHQERRYGYDRVCVFEDENGGNRIIFKDIVSETFNKLGITIPVCERLAKLIYKVFDEAYWDLSDFCDEFIDAFTCDLDFRDDYDQNYACEIFNLNSSDIFNEGRLEGRIWFNKGLITFYPGQQPSRDEMKQDIKDIAKNEGRPESDFYGFYTIFEVGSKDPYTGSGYKIHYDAKIQCCTVADYIEGKYSGFNREDEIEMVKNRKGANKMIHLANQKDKFNFFKNFRKTRDNAVYVPREKAAGSLAAYHAMRYPFGENRIIKEGYSGDYDTEAGTDWPSYYDKKRERLFDGDWRSLNAYPFAYFPTYSNGLKFSVGNAATTHSALAFHVALESYLPEATSMVLGEIAESVASEINRAIDYALKGDKERHIILSNISAASFTIAHKSIINNYNIDSNVGYKIISNSLHDSLMQNKHCDANEIKNKLYSSIKEFCFEDDYYDEYDLRVYYLDSLFQFTELGTGDNYFHEGRLEGRIFTKTQTISFYEAQQPNSEELDEIIRNLSKDKNINLSYDELMEFEIIYRSEDEMEDEEDEDGYLRGKVTGCSVYEYITGKPMDKYINPEERKGSQFIPHLANPEEKFNFFKNFRDTRDRAVYAPREKAAGSLAAYHAMRYPFGENRKSNGKLLINENYDQAGTDFPSYYDENTGEWYEASWNTDYGFPFGYWPIDDAGNEEFFVGKAYDTHAQACGQAAEAYFTTKIRDAAYEAADEITTSLNDFIEYFNENNFQYDEDGDRYISEELPAVKTFDDFVDMVRDNVYTEIGDAYEYMSELVENFLENGSVADYEEIAEHLIEASSNEYSFHERNDIDEALKVVGSDFDTFFEEGHSEGRVWPYANMIGFYTTEQPEPYELMQILHNLEAYIDLDVDKLLEYHMVFEDWSNNGTVTACTVQDYIDGNYGPSDNEDEEEGEKQYARDEKTVFVPHLANQQDKFNFFKNFRDTRDRAVYTPREKAAGSLAAYHAMRYPYGEGRERLLQMIDEEIEMLISESTNSKKAHNRTRTLIANKLGLDVNDNRVIKLESDFERAYFGEGMRTDWFIVLEPLFCSFALELGYGVNNNVNDGRLKELKDYVFRKASLSENKGEYINYIKNNITTYEQFEDFVDKQIEEDEKEENDRLNKQKFSRNNEYSIIGPVDYDTAHKYGNYSNPNGKLCYTQSEDTWNNYTKKGLNACYILLKNGWEGIKAVHDDRNSGYDTYGLSMIFVFVDEKGKLAYCNTRWNHDANYALGCSVDHAMTPTQISNLIGANFNEVFLPKRTIKYSAKKITDLLNSGKKPEDIFEKIIKTSREYDGYPIFEVTYLGKENLLVNNRIVSPNLWFNSINYDSFRRSGIGYGYIKSGDSKGVFFDINGNIINETELTRIIEERLKTLSPNEVFDGIRDCSLKTQTGEIDYNIVNVAGVYNYLMNNGKILSPDMWLIYAQNFNDSDGLALIKTNFYSDHYDFMDINRNIITYANYANSLAEKVKESNGELLNEIFRVWEEKNGYYRVSLKMDSYNVLDSNFNVVFPQHWFKRSSKIDPKNNTILFSKPEANNSNYGVCGYLKTGEVVDLSEHIDRMSQYIANGGNPNDIFEEVGETSEGKTVVKDATLGKNYITKNGILCEKWYVEANPFKENFGVVSVRSGGFNYVNENGEELLDENVDYAENFNSGKAIIGKLVENEDDEYNEDEMSYLVIDTNGNNLLDEEYFGILDDVKSGNPDSIIDAKLFSDGVLELVVLKNGELMECGNTWQDNTEEGIYPHYAYYAASLVNEGKAKPGEVFDKVFEEDNHYVVKIGGRYNFMTKDFKIPHPKVWANYVSPHYNDGWRKVKLGYYGGNYINDNLEYMIPMETMPDLLNTFREVSDFSEGLAAVKFRLNKTFYSDDEEKANCGYIDTTGKPAFDELFANAKPFYNGKASVVYWTGENYDYGSIDREGNRIK